MKKYLFPVCSLILTALLFSACSSLVAELNTEIITSYKVEHYLQTTGCDGYTCQESDTQTFKVRAKTMTEASVNTYAGFTNKPFVQEEVNRKGTTVIRIYYDRNIVPITFNLAGGSSQGQTGSITVDARYGTRLDQYLPANVEKAGCSFGAWSPALDATVPLEPKSFTAQWMGSLTISINVAEADIQTNSDTSNPAAIIITPDSGYTSYTWTKDNHLVTEGVDGTTGVLTLDTTYWSAGTYEIGLCAYKNGSPYTALIYLQKTEASL